MTGAGTLASSTFGILGPLFALMVVGYAVARSGILSVEGTRTLTRLVSTVEIPVLLFRSVAFASDASREGWLIALVYLLGCVGVFALAFVASRFIFRLDQSEVCIFGLSSVYSNSSLIGIPVAQALLGTAGVVLLSKIIAVHSLVLIPGATLYLTLAATRQNHRALRQILPLLTNPMILALATGYLLAETGASLPRFGMQIVDSLATAATPTALIAVGATLAGLPRPTEARAELAIVALKLVAHPLLVWTIATAMELPDKAIALATVTAALPPGINAYAMAVQYGRYQDEAVRSFALGTLLSAGSVTLLLQVTGWKNCF